MRPPWLPSELTFPGGSVQDDYNRLYAQFTQDFLSGNRLQIEGDDIVVDPTRDSILAQYECGFTHLVTRESGGQRFIDYDRAKKLSWARPLIENYSQPEVYSFWYQGADGPELYLWLFDHDYVVILKPWRGARYATTTKVVVTAFSVESWKRRDLQRKYGRASRIL